jgi:shikimate dehydrogenase
MRYSALIGNPTEHSISPLLFEWISEQLSQPIEYKHLKIDISQTSELSPALKAFQTLKFCGLNVTLPYKLDVISILDKLDDSISSIGAVNTVVFDTKKNLSIGYNTDWYGIYRPLSGVIAEYQKKKALVFGTGGAARAAIYAVLELGIKDVVVLYRIAESNRTKSLQNQFSDKTTIRFDVYEGIVQHIDTADIIINATSTGMVGQDAKTPFALDLLKNHEDLSRKIFFDCVFNPVNTPLASYFKSSGARTIDGLWMMIYQGLYAFMLWTGNDVLNTLTEDNLLILHKLLQKRIQHV